MSYIMRLFLAGLIAFVPSQDGNGVQILLLDAREPSLVGHCTSLPHEPFLVVRATDLLGDRTQQCGCSCGGGGFCCGGGGFCCWPLDKVTVQIHGLKDQSFKNVNGVRGSSFIMTPHQLPESSSEGPDTSWLADMGKIASKGGKLLSGSSTKYLVSRLEIRKGRMETCHLVKMGTQELERVPVFEFRPFGVAGSSSRLTQALADEVKIEASMDSEFLSIYRIPFGAASVPPPPINLKSPVDGRLGIAIINMPQNKPFPQDSDCEAVDVDFFRFFKLLDPLEKTLLPHRSNVFGSISVEPPNCDDDVLSGFFHGEGEDEGKLVSYIFTGTSCARSAYTRPICAMAAFPQ